VVHSPTAMLQQLAHPTVHTWVDLLRVGCSQLRLLNRPTKNCLAPAFATGTASAASRMNATNLCHAVGAGAKVACY
jgi:hypothetical protein